MGQDVHLSNVPARYIFYILNKILCAVIEYLASKRLLCSQNSTILQVLTIHSECLRIIKRFFANQISLAEFFDAILSQS